MSTKSRFSATLISLVTVPMITSPLNAAVAKRPVHQAIRSPTPQAEPTQCGKLRTDYDNASKELALAQAYDVMDDSAVRSTMRNSENANTIAQARMTFDIMKGQGCKLPDYAPSADRYGLQSLHCVSALQSQRADNAMADLDNRPQSYETPKECDTSLWTSKPE